MEGKIKKDNVLIIDNEGLVMEQGKNFPNKISGSLFDIMTKAKEIFENEEIISISLSFENNDIPILYKKDSDKTISAIIDKKK
jgi:hypothetical protein